MHFARRPAALALPALLAIAAACADPAAPPAPGAAASPPRLIVNGTPTGGDFANVGALMFDFDENGKIEGLDQLCTVSLISPTVFLTAAHCVSFLPPTAQLYVTFN